MRLPNILLTKKANQSCTHWRCGAFEKVESLCVDGHHYLFVMVAQDVERVEMSLYLTLKHF